MYRYIGTGAYIVGVPTRDLTDREAQQYGEARLVASGLYEAPKRSYKPPKRDEIIEEQEIDNG
jgi:hypothetical protein